MTAEASTGRVAAAVDGSAMAVVTGEPIGTTDRLRRSFARQRRRLAVRSRGGESLPERRMNEGPWDACRLCITWSLCRVTNRMAFGLLLPGGCWYSGKNRASLCGRP